PPQPSPQGGGCRIRFRATWCPTTDRHLPPCGGGWEGGCADRRRVALLPQLKLAVEAGGGLEVTQLQPQRRHRDGVGVVQQVEVVRAVERLRRFRDGDEEAAFIVALVIAHG